MGPLVRVAKVTMAVKAGRVRTVAATVIAVGTLSLCALGLILLAAPRTRAQAAEKPPAEHVEAMRTLAVVAQELPKRLAEDDAAGLDKLVIAARPAIGVVERYWAARGAEDAIAFAATASKAIAEISVAVHLMADGSNPMATEGAEESIKNLNASCVGCHQAHRETLPDGSYAIK